MIADGKYLCYFGLFIPYCFVEAVCITFMTYLTYILAAISAFTSPTVHTTQTTTIGYDNVVGHTIITFMFHTITCYQ